MNPKKILEYLNKDFWLVLGTWALVIVTLYSTWKTVHHLKDQLVEFRRATELQWRPYLNIGIQDSIFYSTAYFLGENPQSDTVRIELNEVKINSKEFFSVQKVGIQMNYKLKYWNSGATPLRLTAFASSIISQDDWYNTLGKSEEKLVERIKDSLSLYETDVIILPSDTFKVEKPKKVELRMPKSQFKSQLEQDSALVFYPYVYLTYEDFFGGKYNLLRVEMDRIPLVVKDGFATPMESKTRISLEKYRWDLNR